MTLTAHTGRTVGQRPSLSVIVPVHHDNVALAALLPQLADDRLETVVATSGHDATCLSLCRRHGARAVVAERACRGAQLNAGAAVARGDVLWFLHADARPPVGAIEALLDAVADGAVGGCFRFAFADAAGIAPRVIAAGVALRCRLGGMPYGDQGLFATRAAFEAAGGFDPTPLFEEVPLVHGLRRHGRFARIGLALPVSARRWQRDGWWRRSLVNRALALGYMLGVPPARLAATYTARRRTHAGGASDG